MKTKCNSNPIIKYIRILLSLALIGLGFYYKSWLGAVGVITLISAFTGECAFSLKFNRKCDFKLPRSTGNR
ncbi:MAG: DUF2892 domain-containing protein [Candidatus Aminicenantes bacterium]|nr:DUF2892 domain-containing protein [Candidatus Aminicenantes bacterium]